MNKANNLKIAYIGGGSRGWAWGFMTDIACDEQISGTVRLYDIDREAAERLCAEAAEIAAKAIAEETEVLEIVNSKI